MSIIGSFIKDKRRARMPRGERTTTYVEDNRLVIVPEDTDTLIGHHYGLHATTRPLIPPRRQYFFSPTPNGPYPDRFIEIGITAEGKRIVSLRGAMMPWGHRTNIYRPIPGTYGDQFEIGAPE